MSNFIPFMLLGAPQAFQIVRNLHRKEVFDLYTQTKDTLKDIDVIAPTIYVNDGNSEPTPISIGISMVNYDGTPIVPYDYSDKVYPSASIPPKFHSLKRTISVIHADYSKIFEMILEMEHEILVGNTKFSSQQFAEHLLHYFDSEDSRKSLLFTAKKHPNVEQHGLFQKIKTALEAQVAMNLLNEV